MTDPMRPLRVLDALGRARALGDAAQVLISLPLFAEPFRGAAIATQQAGGAVVVQAHAADPATPSLLTDDNLWESSELRAALARENSSVLSVSDGQGLNGSLWVLPVRTASDVLGVVAGWSDSALPPAGLGSAADTVLTAGVKRLLRALAITHSPPGPSGFQAAS